MLRQEYHDNLLKDAPDFLSQISLLKVTRLSVGCGSGDPNFVCTSPTFRNFEGCLAEI